MSVSWHLIFFKPQPNFLTLYTCKIAKFSLNTHMNKIWKCTHSCSLQKDYPWELFYLLLLALPDVEEEEGPGGEDDAVGLGVGGSRGNNPAIFIPSVSEIWSFYNEPHLMLYIDVDIDMMCHLLKAFFMNCDWYAAYFQNIKLTHFNNTLYVSFVVKGTYFLTDYIFSECY